MQTVLSALQYIEKKLSELSINNAGFEARYLVSELISVPQTEVYLYKHCKLSACEQQILTERLLQRMQHKPLQYITGNTEFMGRKFKLNEAVLIPRVETELLVMRIVQDHQQAGNTHRAVLEIGTGSGIVAISLAKIFPHWEIDATDTSGSILQLAGSNARKHDAGVNFIKSDLFENVNHKDYDLLVSNPPYISDAEFAKLPTEIKYYEPQQALVAAENGLFYYRAILEQAAAYLKEEGKIYFEIGAKQLAGLEKLAEENGFKITKVDKDYNNYDRVVVLSVSSGRSHEKG